MPLAKAKAKAKGNQTFKGQASLKIVTYNCPKNYSTATGTICIAVASAIYI